MGVVKGEVYLRLGTIYELAVKYPDKGGWNLLGKVAHSYGLERSQSVARRER